MKHEIKNNGVTATIRRVHCWPMGDKLLFQLDTKEKRPWPEMSIHGADDDHLEIQFYDNTGDYPRPRPDMTRITIWDDERIKHSLAFMHAGGPRYGFLFLVCRQDTEEERQASFTLYDEDA